MGAGAGSVTDNTSTFESNLKAQCYSASSASNFIGQQDLDGSTDCSVSIMQEATSYANCTVDQVAAAVAETAQTTSSDAESDLFGRIIGNTDLISTPNKSLLSNASRESIRDTLPRRVLISPL